jgi:ATP-dependent DNA helicase RecQ
LRLGTVIEALGHPTVVALTATAAPPVRDEICERLGLVDPAVVVRGFDRPNIALSVVTFTSEDDKRADFVLRVAGEPKPGIVYAATRASAEELAAALADIGLAAEVYHGGLRAADRERVHQSFTGDRADVVVATTAFGMGIDKANVRFVLHYDIADSLDSYYQEIGRAGRDGQPARATLLYRPEDVGVRRFFAGASPDRAAVRKVATLLLHAPGPVGPEDLQAEAGLSARRLGRAVDVLVKAAVVQVSPRGEIAYADPALTIDAALERAQAVTDSRARIQQSRVEMMQAYAETRGCRRQPILSYFGEPAGAPCGNCDNCLAGLVDTTGSAQQAPYPLSSRVAHAEWGRGLVMRYEEDRIVVLFDEVGYKTLSLEAVAARRLLGPAT